MSLEHEATDTPVTFDYFGRSWTLPPAMRAQHHQHLNAILAGQFVRHWDLALAEAFLPADQFKALIDEVNPTNDELDQFGNEIAKRLGFQGSGN